jgi:catechol O-methyltransferase
MMHIGERKAKYLEEAILSLSNQEYWPLITSRGEVLVELGSYCGYSALRMARLLSPNGKLYCIEREPSCVKWTSRLLSYAGLVDKVHLIEGSISDNTLDILSGIIQENHNVSTIELLFIDHDKSLYKCDLETFFNRNFIRSGSVVVADNVLTFSSALQEYLDYVKDPTGPFLFSTTYRDLIEYAGEDADPNNALLVDGVEVSVVK